MQVEGADGLKNLWNEVLVEQKSPRPLYRGAVAQAAAVQYLAALPVAHHSLFATQPVLEYDRSAHPFRQQLVTRPLQMLDGWVDVPDAPGLGIEVDRQVLQRFSL